VSKTANRSHDTLTSRESDCHGRSRRKRLSWGCGESIERRRPNTENGRSKVHRQARSVSSRIHRLRQRPNGLRVLAASFDNTARLWDPQTNVHRGAAYKHQGEVKSAAFSPPTTTRPHMATWRPALGRTMHTKGIQRVVITQTGLRLATSPVTNHSGRYTHDQSRHRIDQSSSRNVSNKPSNGS